MDRDSYCTPEWVLEPVYRFLGTIGLDPCSGAGSIVKSVNKFTKEDDGLSKDWTKYRDIFVNPPYSKPNLSLWSAKCAESQESEVLLLVPANTSAAWFQNNVFKTATSILFYNKRISFLIDGASTGSPNFHSVLVYWGLEPDLFASAFRHQGAVVHLSR